MVTHSQLRTDLCWLSLLKKHPECALASSKPPPAVVWFILSSFRWYQLHNRSCFQGRACHSNPEQEGEAQQAAGGGCRQRWQQRRGALPRQGQLLLSGDNTRSHAHVYNNDVLDRCACCIKLILRSVVFVLAKMDKMIELECYIMGKWISNVR